MVSDEVCGVVQGRFEFCGGIKSGEVMGGYVWKADRLQASGAYKLLVVWKVVSCDIMCIISNHFFYS